MFQYFLILAMVEIWIWLDLIKANFFWIEVVLAMLFISRHWAMTIRESLGGMEMDGFWHLQVRCQGIATSETHFFQSPHCPSWLVKISIPSASHWRRQQWSRQPFDLVKHNPPISGLWSNYQQHLRDAFSFPSFCLGQVSRYVPMFCV